MVTKREKMVSYSLQQRPAGTTAGNISIWWPPDRNVAHYVVATNKLPQILNKRSKNTNHVVATHQIKFFLQSYGSVNLGLCYEMCSFYYKKVDHVTM